MRVILEADDLNAVVDKLPRDSVEGLIHVDRHDEYHYPIVTGVQATGELNESGVRLWFDAHDEFCSLDDDAVDLLDGDTHVTVTGACPEESIFEGETVGSTSRVRPVDEFLTEKPATDTTDS
jgi:hypothetical protein